MSLLVHTDNWRGFDGLVDMGNEKTFSYQQKEVLRI